MTDDPHDVSAPLHRAAATRHDASAFRLDGVAPVAALGLLNHCERR